MAIDFSKDRWERVAETARLWWAAELERPLIQIRVHGRNPGRPEPDLADQDFTAFHGLSTPAEAIIDRWDYNLSCIEYLGDAFPWVFPNFGAGIMAAFLAARLQNTSETVWFHPPRDQEIGEIRFRHDPDNAWYRRVLEICEAAAHRWEGTVQVATTDLGGNLDILSTFRPGEKLLLDLYDHPEEVKRLTWEAHELWWQYFSEISVQMNLPNPGYSAWTPLFSEEPYYMLQCDFCYMIGPAMFDEFVRPELEASCRKLDNAFYHLDGPGQIPHLESLLSIEQLKGIQYVPTVSQRDGADYPDLHCRIIEAGKRLQVFAGYSPRLGLELLDVLAHQVGSAKGIAFIADVGADEEDKARRLLERYGAE